MNETNLIIQNRLREATVSLERANLIICDETWKCDSSVPPFSSIQLVLQGEGTICIDETTIHPTSGQLYLLPAYTNQAFFTDIHNPYRTYYCHFEITCQQTRKTRKRPNSFSSISSTASDRMISFLR